VLFWDITQRVVVIPYRCFRTTYWSHLQGSRIQDDFPTSGRDVELSPHTGIILFVISGFCCRVDETVLFWDITQHVVVIPFLALEDQTDRLSQNVGKELPLHTV